MQPICKIMERVHNECTWNTSTLINAWGKWYHFNNVYLFCPSICVKGRFLFKFWVTLVFCALMELTTIVCGSQERSVNVNCHTYYEFLDGGFHSSSSFLVSRGNSTHTHTHTPTHSLFMLKDGVPWGMSIMLLLSFSLSITLILWTY